MDCPANVMLIPTTAAIRQPHGEYNGEAGCWQQAPATFSIVAICVFLQAAMLEKPGCFGGNSLRARSYLK